MLKNTCNLSPTIYLDTMMSLFRLKKCHNILLFERIIWSLEGLLLIAIHISSHNLLFDDICISRSRPMEDAMLVAFIVKVILDYQLENFNI